VEDVHLPILVRRKRGASDGVLARLVGRDPWLRQATDHDAEHPGLVHILEGHEGGVNSVAFSPEGRQLACGSDDPTVWEAETGRESVRCPALYAPHAIWWQENCIQAADWGDRPHVYELEWIEV